MLLNMVCQHRSRNFPFIFPEPVEFTTGWIVYHESMRNTARIRAVIDELVGYFESNANLYSGKMC